MQKLANIVNKVHNADCLTFLRDMPDECVDCCVTSPPYWGLRDYGVEGQLGLEPTIELYISHLSSHFAVFPRALVHIPIKSGCPPNGIVLDPFAGTGTTCLEAKEQGKNYIGIELSPDYVRIAEKKLAQEVLPFSQPKQETQERLFGEGEG